MPLPNFPSGINTELNRKPVPFKKPKPTKPPNPRRSFVAIFLALMALVALYPFLRDWLTLKH
ncbi:MAG: hypothetical protein M3126_06725 [Candidatus Eremiobacteraeota bacterium]|nr:hypothetical protein [Candidatus Eremiobacteraeota bacterium]